jgi:hypothetical protein
VLVARAVPPALLDCGLKMNIRWTAKLAKKSTVSTISLAETGLMPSLADSSRMPA